MPADVQPVGWCLIKGEFLFMLKISSKHNESYLSLAQTRGGMEGDLMQGRENGAHLDTRILHTFQKSFFQVEDILDQNRLLINEITQNHESRIPDNLSRNVGLIRELNSNIRRVADLYKDLSDNVIRQVEESSQGETNGILRSNGKATQKRIRSG